jgi:hypothetical protein
MCGRTVMDHSEAGVEEVRTSQKVAIAKNKAGRQAFMNNAPIDNFGNKAYQCVPSLRY